MDSRRRCAVWLSGAALGVACASVRSVSSARDRVLHSSDHDDTEPGCVKIAGADRCKVAIQTNNVEVDDRGYIYVVAPTPGCTSWS